MWIEVVTCRQRSRRNSRRWRRRRKTWPHSWTYITQLVPSAKKETNYNIFLYIYLSFSLSVSPDPFTWDIILVLPKSWSEVFAVRRYEENGNSCSRNLFSRMRIGQCLLWMWTALVVTGNKHVVSTNSWVWKIFISNWCGWPLLTACKCLHTISHLHVVGLGFLICYIYMPAVVWMPRTSWSSTTRTRLWSTIFAKTRLVRELRFQHFRLISVARRSWANGSGIQTCPTWSSSVVGIRLQSSARMSSSAVWRYQRKESWEDRRQLLWCWGPYSVIATTFQSPKKWPYRCFDGFLRQYQVEPGFDWPIVPSWTTQQQQRSKWCTWGTRPTGQTQTPTQTKAATESKDSIAGSKRSSLVLNRCVRLFQDECCNFVHLYKFILVPVPAP